MIKVGDKTMLNKIIQFSLHNRMFILVVSLLLILGGVYTASNMEVDVFPDLNAPTVVVMTEAQGSPARPSPPLFLIPTDHL